MIWYYDATQRAVGGKGGKKKQGAKAAAAAKAAPARVTRGAARKTKKAD